jgi:four helix bundle protein
LAIPSGDLLRSEWRCSCLDIALEDVSFLVRRGAAALRIAQLERSVESIEANIAEGYSKFSGKDRARFFEMALGSAREAREWYRRSGHMIGAPHAFERRLLLTEIIKILTVVIPQERSGACERRITKAGEKRRNRRPDKRSNHHQ